MLYECNKYAAGTEYKLPLQKPESQYLIRLVQRLSTPPDVKCSAVFPIFGSSLHRDRLLKFVQNAFDLR